MVLQVLAGIGGAAGDANKCLLFRKEVGPEMEVYRIPCRRGEKLPIIRAISGEDLVSAVRVWVWGTEGRGQRPDSSDKIVLIAGVGEKVQPDLSILLRSIELATGSFDLRQFESWRDKARDDALFGSKLILSGDGNCPVKKNQWWLPNGSRLSCGASARGRKRPGLRYLLAGHKRTVPLKAGARQLQALVRQPPPGLHSDDGPNASERRRARAQSRKRLCSW